MHRVELKEAQPQPPLRTPQSRFLMHRVELKGGVSKLLELLPCPRVPNAPCGVESTSDTLHGKWGQVVPNAPCGVESLQLA